MFISPLTTGVIMALITAKRVDTRSTIPYILKSQLEDEAKDQITWNIRTSFTAAERKVLKNAMINDGLEATYIAFHLGLESVDNFYFEDGRPVSLEREKQKYHGFLQYFTEATMDAIPDSAITEIAGEILTKAFVKEEDVKN